MSDLKYQTLEQLHNSKKECEDYIAKLSTQLAGQRQRLEWIDKYIFQNTIQEMSIMQIEKELGHKIIIKQ